MKYKYNHENFCKQHNLSLIIEPSSRLKLLNAFVIISKITVTFNYAVNITAAKTLYSGWFKKIKYFFARFGFFSFCIFRMLLIKYPNSIKNYFNLHSSSFNYTCLHGGVMFRNPHVSPPVLPVSRSIGY